MGADPRHQSGRPLRVIVVHNRHRAALPSGANRAVDDEVAMLRDAGVEVHLHQRSNDEIDAWGPGQRALLPLQLVRSGSDAKALGSLIDRLHPDVVHLHNPYPLVSPWVVRVARARGIPVVQTVHDYLHACAAGTYFRFREGRLCEDCRGRRIPWPAVAHACYHNSRLHSAGMAVAIVAARPSWRLVDRFLAPSSNVADHLVDCGIDRARIEVRAHAVPDPGPPSPPGHGFLFAGRLRSEKGPLLLLDAWKRSGLDGMATLALAGDGPERAALQTEADQLRSVRLLGQISGERVAAEMEAAGVVVVPSQCHETFGLTAAQALSRGRPVIATALGGSTWLVDREVGWLVDSGVEPLREALVAAASADLRPLGTAARRRYEEKLRPEVLVGRLLDIYREVSEGAAVR